jgi:phenylacetic acid degradation operon negative regulatory protein
MPRGGAPSAREYLTTVLGEFVLPHGGRVWTATLIDALGALDVEEKTARQAIARSADRGLLVPEKVGRRTRWHLTDHARALLTEGTKRIYSLHHDPGSWDGRWLLVFVTVPESRRELRYRLRTRLGWAGFAPMAPGAWLSPWVDREAEAKEVLGELGLDGEARSFAGTVGGLGDVGALVAEAWDLDGIRAEYERFITRYRRRRPGADRDAFVATTRLVHDWRQFPFLDPDLPSELLPRGWSGDRAARLFHRLHDQWSPAAMAWWHTHSPPTSSNVGGLSRL